jgi:hypothetical protein
MGYTVYDTISFVSIKWYRSRSGAQRGATCMNRNAKAVRYAVMEDGEYQAFAHPLTRTVKNLMTGQEQEIAINTPHGCDPSSERYWSM